MEQTIQKPPLPIKTKIVAWWMIVIGGLIMISNAIFCFSYFFKAPKVALENWERTISPFIIAICLGLILYIVLYYSFFRKKKLGWLIITIIFSIISILALTFPQTLWRTFPIPSLNVLCVYFGMFTGTLGWRACLFIPFFIPLILLFLDRKNFWKIAS